MDKANSRDKKTFNLSMVLPEEEHDRLVAMAEFYHLPKSYIARRAVRVLDWIMAHHEAGDRIVALGAEGEQQLSVPL